jgi:predicted AlkP superfamily phosphohydrolase/phosphomutase
VAKPRLTVIGLDSATFDVIDPLVEAGELPNLAKLFGSGMRGVLRSTTHPITPHAWTSMVTGVNAGRHGMWDFFGRDETGYRLQFVNGSFRRAPAVWERLSAAGRRVGVMNVPFTWPMRPVEGFAIAGIDAVGQDEGITHPEELLGELRERFGELEFDHGIAIGRDGHIDVDRMRGVIRQRVEAAQWLTERFEPELLFIVFMATDHVQHYGWVDWEERGPESKVADVYRAADEAIGALTDGVDPERDIIVLSDHGAGPLRGVIYLNAWLAENGWLTYVDQGQRIRQGAGAKRLLTKALDRRKRIPAPMRRVLRRRAPGLRKAVMRARGFRAIDWQKTKAFAYANLGNVVVNLRGRESEGIVEPGEEYERLRDEIVAKALELVDPVSGDRVVDTVYKREELFDGPELEKIPDLIVRFDDTAWEGKGDLRKPTPVFSYEVVWSPKHGKERYRASHRREGIVALSGPSVRAGGELSADILDVAPTLFYLLGEPIPLDLEGRLLEEALDERLLESRPPEYAEAADVELATVQTYGAAEADEVEERLRGLGYLE